MLRNRGKTDNLSVNCRKLSNKLETIFSTLNLKGKEVFLMGSTLETAIVFSTVFIVICIFIVLPLSVCGDAYDNFVEGSEEISNYYDSDYNAQSFNFMLTGISENYRMIYGTLGDILDEEG